MVEYADALQHVGEFGIYQKVVFVIGNIFTIAVTLCVMCYVFVGAQPNHWCAVSKLDEFNLTLDEIKKFSIPTEHSEYGSKYSKCSMYDRSYTNLTEEKILYALLHNTSAPVIECSHGWTYDRSQFQSTIITDWDLVCNDSALAATSQSVFSAGQMVGVVVSGALADGVGRKKTLSIFTVLFVITFISSSFAWSYLSFLVLRFTVAFSSVALIGIFFVIITEIVGVSWRAAVGITAGYFWTAGTLILGVSAYFVRDWSHLQLVLAVFILMCIPALIVIPESPRWLYLKGRNDEADNIMHKIAKYNKHITAGTFNVQEKTSTKAAFIWDVLRYPRLRMRVLLLCYMWFTISFVFWGISLNASYLNLGWNDYVNFILLGLTELPAVLFCQLTLNRLGRRIVFAGTYILSGTSLMLVLAVPTAPVYNWIITVLTVIGKFGVTATFNIIYLYTVELFPTLLRTSVLSTASMCARIGSLVAPYMALLSEYNSKIPFAIFGACSLLAGMAALTLPETTNVKLPDTLQEGEDFGREISASEDKSPNKENIGLMELEPLSHNADL